MTVLFPHRCAVHSRLRRVVALAAVLGLAVGMIQAESNSMPSAPSGVIETGAPSFVVLMPEALGLTTPPTDLHLLPDGRVLVVGQHELAFGDGVRWEAFHGADHEQQIGSQVAVDSAGRIYSGTRGAISRVELIEGARWHFVPEIKLPEVASSRSLPKVAMLPDHWYWFGDGDSIVSWRPGNQTGIAGRTGAVDKVFSLNQRAFFSHQNSGGVFLLRPDGATETVQAADILVSESVTCATSYGPDQLLVGTVAGGLKLFDGKEFRAFGPGTELLNGKHRITDVGPAGDGFFAAAVDTIGIVFFDRAGRTVQVLERTLDHRLARVERLCYAPGVLWALLDDGVARIKFPSPISDFAPLLTGGLAFTQPLRHDGRLWIIADGRAMRGVYDASQRLNGFVDDTPPGRFLFTLTEIAGQLFAGNNDGIYLKDETGWKMILPGIVNARLSVDSSNPERLCFVARGEYGVIERTAGIYTATRIPAPELGDSYNASTDAAGIGWIELGIGRIARLDPHGKQPGLRILGAAEGLAQDWIELYIFEGIARFHAGRHLFRFDDAQQKFVEDVELPARFPQLGGGGGRPVTDGSGRIWVTNDKSVEVIARDQTGSSQNLDLPPIGFAPTGYTMETDGIIWMSAKRRLIRLDLRLPQPPKVPLQALITSVQLPASNRQLFDPGSSLGVLGYADNSLTIHFAAPANPFGSPVTFEFLLEGAGAHWVSTGAVASASFYRLKERDYVFRVRPVVAGTGFGAEARLAFTVQPPWYRSPLAWGLYLFSAVGLVGLAMWFSSFLQRRENERLERIVRLRTGELSASEERFRVLNVGLERRVQERTTELQQKQTQLVDALQMARLAYWEYETGDERFTFNDEFYSLLHTTVEIEGGYLMLLTRYAERFVHPEDAAIVRLELHRAVTASDRHLGREFDHRIIFPDGRTGHFHVNILVESQSAGGKFKFRGAIMDITARKLAETKLEQLHQQLLKTSRRAGMAEVATSVLHNVGNVLNSVNVSATLVSDHVLHSKSANLAKVCALLDEHKTDIAAFLTTDPKGMIIPAYLDTLAENLTQERTTVIGELENLRKNIEHIKDIVSMQQSYAKNSGFTETVSLPDLIEDAVRINAGSLAQHDVDLVRDYEARPVVTLDPHKVMQILINLIRNAEYACDESGRVDKVITIRTSTTEHSVIIAVIDNGVGIPPENLTRIFSHGFTTRKSGHGFGLHSGALAAKELNGSLSVKSEGPGQGATFTLELPYKPETPPPGQPTA